MIIVRASQEEMKSAAKIAKVVQLLNVSLSSVRARNGLIDALALSTPRQLPGLDARFGYRVAGHRFATDSTLLVEVAMNLQLLRQSTTTPEKGVSSDVPRTDVEVHYVAHYSIDKGILSNDLPAVDLDAFARLNGLYNCWPYLRQEIDRLTSAMGIPFVLPVLRIQREPAPEQGVLLPPSGNKQSTNESGEANRSTN